MSSRGTARFKEGQVEFADIFVHFSRIDGAQMIILTGIVYFPFVLYDGYQAV